jgi:hypothetical protein
VPRFGYVLHKLDSLLLLVSLFFHHSYRDSHPLDHSTLPTLKLAVINCRRSLETRFHVMPVGQNPFLYPPEYGCNDPYLEPGYLNTNNLSIAENYWTPFSDECPRAPHFLQDVIDRKPLPWLKSRTLLMIGDSVDRNNLNFFCSLVNSTTYPVTLRVTSMTNLSEVHISDSEKDPTNKDPGDLTLPRVCRVEEYDFEIINFFHYGMHDTELWKEKKVYTPPGVIEKRIPMVKPLMADYGRKPDMILLASGTSF